MKVNNFNYDKILTHAKYLIKMNKHILGNRLNPDDVVSEVYIKHCETGKEIEKLTRDIVITERRRLTAIKQQNSTKKRFIEKKCKRCNEIKPCNEFYQKYNKDLGFTYYSLYCKICESVRAKEYREKYGIDNHNKKRRKQYKNNLRAKELAHLRYLKFKNKNKSSLLSKA